jgi:hypothetical protein
MVLAQVGFLADVVTTVPTVGDTWATPAFIAAVATLIASITGLIVALRSQSKVDAVAVTQAAHTATSASTSRKVDQVVTNTNGVMDRMESRISQLEQLLVDSGVLVPTAVAANHAATQAPVAATPPAGQISPPV